MGIGIVLVFWALMGTLFAAIGAAILAFITRYFVRPEAVGRNELIRFARRVPFRALPWAVVGFVFQAVVNDVFFHRDPGLGDSWQTPLPNGYMLMMIDLTDQAWVYNPATQGADGVVGDRDNAMAGVTQLQVSGRYILGKADQYFLLDTTTGQKRQFSSAVALAAAVRPLGISPTLEPVDNVYQRYRFTWFDAVALLLLLLPPAAGTLTWVIRLIRLRKQPITA